ncbi:DUF5671 domain-containing protein [Arenimonas aestuarii]
MANTGTQELAQFVRDALASGQDRESIARALAAAGWPDALVADALAAYADVPFPVPVPRPRPYLSAREAFLYLTLFATLYISAFQLGSLLFDLINRAWPDPADQAWQVARQATSMRWAMASILVAFPVYLFLANHLSQAMARSPEKRLSAVRRWLTYLTLFIAACVLVGDLITLVHALLSGELTLRFALKVGVVAMITGGIFGWYLWDLRNEERES